MRSCCQEGFERKIQTTGLIVGQRSSSCVSQLSLSIQLEPVNMVLYEAPIRYSVCKIEQTLADAVHSLALR